MDFYNENGIKWFLFTPGMSTVIGTNYREKMHICLGAGITYEDVVRHEFGTCRHPDGFQVVGSNQCSERGEQAGGEKN